MRRTMVVSVFAGCGKTWLANHQNKYGYSMRDSDSSTYEKTAGWEKEYINSFMKEAKSGKYDFIFVCQTESVIDEMDRQKIPYVIVEPDNIVWNEQESKERAKERQIIKQQWFGRFILRDNSHIKNFSKWLNHMKDIKATPEGADYQKGPRYNLATLREAVFYRDNYTCQVCGREASEGAILHVHHMFYWKGRHDNSLSELITVCEKCHTPANHQKGGKLYGFGEDIKFANLSGAAFMNTVRWQIVNELYAAFGKPFVTFTYGAMTKEKRIALHLEKSHNNDAYAMGEFHPNCRCTFEHYEKVRRNNRILEKFYDSRYIDIRTGEIATGKELFNGRINRSHKKDSENLHKYRGKRIRKGYRALRRKKVALNPGDLVSLNGEILTVHGTHTKKNGSVNVEFKTPSKSGKKSTSLKKLKIIKTISPMRSAWDKVS